ncbi:hypothetical protein PILCRDRAFT_5501 [Piloderma croceum F 1598]|uniref:Uncharacterized protein n=1 Tax=Piloderma croceum (strain F 1598) TaxID=765440 RepID=A0A0C3FM65_PILCF|nr:hypothetical protein PILCRDRAFT_5501 [Piloderma croceum F 1598]
MTINSITAHPPPTDPYAHITIPDPPSREPSPPSEAVAFSPKGNLFTQSDTNFMLKLISWELQCNPTLNKSDLSHKLEAKAPHHPFSSWMQHIRAAGPIVDKMIATACGEEEDDFSEIESSTKSEFDAAWQQLGSGSGAGVGEFDENSADDDMNMGLPGKNYTAADRRLLAKYIATVDDWNYQDDSVRFAKFHERFPHRALRSWSRYYARNGEGIDRLANKYKEQTEESVSDRTSRRRLSWASSDNNASLPSALKRKFGLTQTDLG